MKLNIRTLQNLALMVVCAWIISPPLLINDEARLAALAAMLLWGGLELFRRNNIFLRPTLPVLGAVALILHEFLIWYAFREQSIFASTQFFIFLLFVLVYESRRESIRSLESVFWFVLLLSPIWLFTTWQAFETFGAHAARHVVRSSEIAFELMEQGVGGYSLIYSVIVLVPITLAMVLRPRSFDFSRAPLRLRDFPLLLRGMLAAVLFLVLLVIVKGGYALAVLIAFLVLFLIVLSVYVRRGAIWLSFIAGVAVMLALEWFLDDMIQILLPLSDGMDYQRKLLDIQEWRAVGESMGSVSDRMERYLRSLGLFFDNPFIGALAHGPTGNHSAFLDNLAKRGFLFGGIYIALVFYLPMRMLRLLPENRGLVVAVLVVVGLFPLVNTMPMAYGVMLFIMFPVACGLTWEYGRRVQTKIDSRRAPSVWRQAVT